MLLLVALSALAIGGLGMSSAAAAFAASRRPTIAILKLVGATGERSDTMLLAEIGLIAGLAISPALPWGRRPRTGRQAHRVPAAGGARHRRRNGRRWARRRLFGVLISFAASWRMVAAAGDTRPARLLRGDVGNGDPMRWDVHSASGRRWRWRPPSPLPAPAIRWFAAIGHRRDCRPLRPVRAAWRRRPPHCPAAKHLGGPVTRLGIAALDRPGAATGRLAVSLGLGLTLLVTPCRDGVEHPCRDRHDHSQARRRPCSWSIFLAPKRQRLPCHGAGRTARRRAAAGAVAARPGHRGQRRPGHRNARHSRRRLDPARATAA